MEHEKAKNMFELSLNQMTTSLEDLPKNEESENIKFNIVMEHASGIQFRAGICHCRDSKGDFKWMRCEDCQNR